MVSSFEMISSATSNSNGFPPSREYNVICFGGEDWWYHNRYHLDMQLMRRFAKRGTVLYINSIVMQKPVLREGKKLARRVLRKAKSISKGLTKSESEFWVWSPFTLPVQHLNWARPFNDALLRGQVNRMMCKLGLKKPIIWVACPAACNTAMILRKSKLVYQRTDRYEEFPNVDAGVIKRYDRELKANADLTLFVNSTLYNEEAEHCKKAIYLDHGVDFELFASAEQNPWMPAAIVAIPKPIIGFFGEIADHTVDLKYVEQVADHLPSASFVFIGKEETDCSGLRAKRNVWLLGRKEYEDIPFYGKCFDVAIMPWRQNRWIEACNPIKLKEYLALGKPIVSTPFPELRKYQDVIYIARTPAQFAQLIERALSEDCPELAASRREKVRTASWESKAELVLKELFG